jgi:hypothetical protein
MKRRDAAGDVSGFRFPTTYSEREAEPVRALTAGSTLYAECAAVLGAVKARPGSIGV